MGTPTDEEMLVVEDLVKLEIAHGLVRSVNPRSIDSSCPAGRDEIRSAEQQIYGLIQKARQMQRRALMVRL